MRSHRHAAVRFVPQLSPNASQVEKELELANQKSHAARWSHAKRRQKKKEQEEGWKAQSLGKPSLSLEIILTNALLIPPLIDSFSNDGVTLPSDLAVPKPEQRFGTRSSRLDVESSVSKKRAAIPNEQSLLEILACGNSDPFNSQGLPITPHINKLITFIRDAYLPGVYITSYMKRRESAPGASRLTTIADGFHVFGRRAVARVWSSMKEELSDEGRALSWCSSYLPVLAKFSSPDTARELNLVAIKMRAKSMQLLKDHIEKLSLDTEPDISLISQVVSLFRAACKEGDIPAAQIHAGIIQRLVDRVEFPDRHIRTLFMTCMNNDSEVAIAQMRNTFFDYENWIQKQILRIWAETLERNLPQLSPECDELPKSIAMPPTRYAAIRLRRYLFYRSTMVDLDDAEDLERTDAVFTNFTTYSQYDAGVLINVYINLVAGKVYNMKESLRYINAGLALTVLHVLRRGIFEATVYGTDHRSSHHIIVINHLEGTMRKAMLCASAEELCLYREALLWVCFYGARFEWRVNQKINGVTAPRTWF